jgi:hypothetical protein
MLFTASPTIQQIYCGGWNSSFGRADLEDHLRIANKKGTMVFQSAETEHTRTFLRAVLQGRGIEATCRLRPLDPNVAATELQQLKSAATAAGASFSDASDANAVRTLQSCDDATRQLFLDALKRMPPLWFHEEPAAGPAIPAAAAAAAASSPMVIANAEPTVASPHLAAFPLPQRRKDSAEADRSSLHPGLLPFVQCLSKSQPATPNSPALPSVLICNQTRKRRIAGSPELPEEPLKDLVNAFLAAFAAYPTRNVKASHEKKRRRARSSSAGKEAEMTDAAAAVALAEVRTELKDPYLRRSDLVSILRQYEVVPKQLASHL